MSRPRGYKIIYCDNTDGLAVYVNVAIDAGWEPLGRPVYAENDWYQAMVK